MLINTLLFISGIVILPVNPGTAIELIAAGALVLAGGAYNVLLRTFITYVLTNPETGMVYIGRTSGFGEPNKIVSRRMFGHKYYNEGFTIQKVDKAMQGWDAYRAIRGREQQLIDFFGGIGASNVANKIRAVSKIKENRKRLHDTANEYFGELHIFTGIP